MTNYKELIESDGGFTVSLLNLESPTTGYMVSLRGLTRKIPLAEFTDKDVNAYRVAMTAKGCAKSHHYIGAWLSDGTVYLDVSENISNRGWAVKSGISRNQISIWDVENSEAISTGGTGE